MTPLSFILLGLLLIVGGVFCGLLVGLGEAGGSFLKGLAGDRSPPAEPETSWTLYGVIFVGAGLLIYGTLKAGLANFFISILEFFT